MKRALLAVLLALPVAAQAGDYLSYKMLANAQQPFRFYVDSRSNRPAGIDYVLMQNAAERAWASWNAVQCASVKVRSEGASVGTVPNPVQTTDAYSVAPIWMLTADADAAEVFGPQSLIVAISLPRAYAGVLQTCDIFFNALPNSTGWSVDSVVPADRLDVETVVLHEGGHCLGLDHSGPVESVMHQVVEAGEPVRTPGPTDVQLLCNRYPLSGANGAPCLADGGCLASTEKCLAQPVTNGLTTSLCTNGCATGSNGACAVPLSCQASSSFSSAGFNGACLLPGSIVTRVGAACAQDSECGNSFGNCRPPELATSGNNNYLWVGGYCTQGCAAGQPVCPAGSTCVGLDIGQRCAQDCRVGLADCRPGYTCEPIDALGTSGVCVPRCYGDLDCVNPAVNTCRSCDGMCVPRQNSAAQIGDGCTTDANCGSGQTCRVTDPMLPQIKQCTQQCARGCGVCPQGSTCTPGTSGELFCLKTCSGPGTCPAGLRCADTQVGKACLPSCQNDTNCPVGEYCYLGECYLPTVDAGCGTLCNKPDAGKPVVVVPKDAGSGNGGTGGCGCTTVDPLSAFAMVLVAAAALGRRSKWRQP